jgi:hypothetical protein
MMRNVHFGGSSTHKSKELTTHFTIKGENTLLGMFTEYRKAYRMQYYEGMASSLSPPAVLYHMYKCKRVRKMKLHDKRHNGIIHKNFNEHDNWNAVKKR